MNKILKTLIFFAQFFFVFVLARGQDIVFEKADFIHGNGIDKVADILLDADDNLYIVGTFENNGNIAGIEMQKQVHPILFIAKYNSAGTLQYTKQFSGTGEITAHSLASDSRNNVYLSGTFRKTCRFGEKELTATTWQNNFMLKLSPAGSIMKIKQIEARTKDAKTFLLCDAKDNVYYAGSFYKTMAIDKKELESTSSSDIFIAKFDSDFNLQNLKAVHGKNKDLLSAAALTEEGQLVIAGSFTDDINFDGKQYISIGRKDIFWAELNLNPTAESTQFVNRVKQIGGLYDDYPTDILIKNNKLYLTGSFSNEVKFGNDRLKTKGILDVFVASYKLNGKELWAQSFGGQANDYARSLAMSNKGNIYVSGNFRESIEQNGKSIKTKEHQSDNFIAVLTEKGDLRNIKSFGGDDNDFPVKTVIDKNNILYHTGTYRSDFIFGNNKSMSRDTKNNIFLVQMYDCDNTELNLGDDIEVCGNTYVLSPDINFETYQWSNGSSEKGTEITASGTYTLNVTDRFGCPATDDINVTLHDLPTVDLGEDMTCTAGNTVTINAESGFENYFWTASDNLQNFKTSGQQLIINTEDLTEGTYSYSLTATDINGCSCSDRIKLTILNKQKPLDLNAFSAEIIPNPNDGRFTLYITNADTKSKITYEIYSPDSKLILKKTAKSLKEQINLQSKAEGSYILKIINGTSVITKPIIVSEK